MLKGGIPIGRVFGISLKLNYSWFIVFGLVTWALTTSYFPATFPDWSLTKSIIAGIVTSLLFFGSVLAHELMHSVVAQATGIKVHSITLFIFGGVSQMTEEPRNPKDELRIALAGPLTSLVIGGIFWAIWYWLGNTSQFLNAVAFWLGMINIFLAGFNLIPGFPLDGGRVLRSILWLRSQNLRRATRTASNIGRGVGFLFIFGGIYFVFRGLWFNGLWLAFIGWFLENAAVGSYRQVALQEILQGHVASEIMTRDCPVVAPELTIEQLVNQHILAAGIRCLPVVTDNRVMGLVTLNNIKTVPRERWATQTVKDAMTPLDRLKSVSLNEDLAKVLQVMAEEDVNQIPVVEDGNIVGMIARDSLLAFISVRGELGM
jgi:Zn-dependent protease/predicted transcriptional regulator